MIQARHMIYPARFQPYLDLILDGFLQRVKEAEAGDDLPDVLQDGTPRHIMATLTISRPLSGLRLEKPRRSDRRRSTKAGGR